MAEPAQNEVGAPDPEDEDRDVQQEHLADRHGPQSLKLGQDLRRVAEIDDDADHHEAEQDRQSLTSSCPGSSPGGNARIGQVGGDRGSGDHTAGRVPGTESGWVTSRSHPPLLLNRRNLNQT